MAVCLSLRSLHDWTTAYECCRRTVTLVFSLLLLPSIVQIVGDYTKHTSDQLANFVDTGVVARAPCQLRTLPANTVAFVDFDKGKVYRWNVTLTTCTPDSSECTREAVGRGLLQRHALEAAHSARPGALHGVFGSHSEVQITIMMIAVC